MVALKIIVIIYLNSNWVYGEEVTTSNEEIEWSNVQIELSNEEIELIKEDITRSEEEITASEEENLLIEMIPVFYRNYRDVLRNTNETKSQRRIFKNNREYELHVEKLKGVNGYKKHNLIIRESTKNNPLIYINNPVETKIPNAYLTLQDFKSMLAERISKQREQFKKDNLKPKVHKNKPVPVKVKNIGIKKGKRIRTTVFFTKESQTESSKNISMSTPKSILTENKKQYNNSVTFRTTDASNATTINHIFEKNNQSYNFNETTFSMLNTEVTQKQNLNKVKENETLQDTLFQHPGDTIESKDFDAKPQNISKLDTNKPLEDEILTKSLKNVTESNLDAKTTDGIEVTRSNLEENKQNFTELDERNQENENVESTPENVTDKVSEITTENKYIQITEAEAIEQNISKLEKTNPLREEIKENTTTGTTEATPEVVTEQTEEVTTDPEVVTEETTSTTIKTTRKRLSKPLVWIGSR